MQLLFNIILMPHTVNGYNFCPFCVCRNGYAYLIPYKKDEL